MEASVNIWFVIASLERIVLWNAVVFSFAFVGACLDSEMVLVSGNIVGLELGLP